MNHEAHALQLFDYLELIVRLKIFRKTMVKN